MQYERLRDFFDDARIRAVVEKQQGIFAANGTFYGDSIFPRQAEPNDTIVTVEATTTQTPMGYATFAESSKMVLLKETIKKITFNLMEKKGKGNINQTALQWLRRANLPAVDRFAAARASIAKQIGGLTASLYTTNNLEAMHAIVYGEVKYLHGEVFQYPWLNYDHTNHYHATFSWFDNSGNVIPAATIIDNIETVKEAIKTAGGRTPTRMVMNSKTFKALRDNTLLNSSDVPNLWDPVYWLWVNQAKNPSPLGVKWEIMDDTYFHPTTKVATKYLPDYYVLFMPETLGYRAVGMNSFNDKTSTYSRSWVDNDPPNLWYEVGETSAPIPTDLNSLYTVYVKAP